MQEEIYLIRQPEEEPIGLQTVDQLKARQERKFRMAVVEQAQTAYEGLLALQTLSHLTESDPTKREQLVLDYPRLANLILLSSDIHASAQSLEALLSQLAAALGIDQGFGYGLERQQKNTDPE